MTAGKAFRRSYRLLRPQEYAEVFAQRRTVRGQHFVIHWHLHAHVARIGLVIPKKNARSAVLRNALKRQIREAFRLRRDELPTVDMVVRLAQPIDRPKCRADKAHKHRWREEIESLFDSLRQARQRKPA